MQISDNLRAVEERIKRSCITSKIELSKVKILAVSKKMNVEKIQEAYNAGLNSFGENYELRTRGRHVTTGSFCLHLCATLK